MVRRSLPLLALFTMTAVPALAQQPVGPEFRVNSHTTSSQYQSAVASAADGSFVVAWTSASADGSGSGIVGQRFDRLGNPRGTEFLVNAFTTGAQYIPAIASDSSGRFVIAWASLGQDGSSSGVFARRFDSSGIPLGAAEFRVNSYTTSSQTPADAAYDASGNLVIVWQSLGQDGSSYGTFGRRFDTAGAPLGQEFRVNTYTTSRQMGSTVATAADGSFVVVWQGNLQDGSTEGVFGQRFDSTGNPVGAEFQVTSYTTNEQRSGNVAMDAAGNFVVVWDSLQQDGSQRGIFGQRFDAAGNRLGGEFAVNTYTAQAQETPRVVREAEGRFVVAWASQQDGSNSGVFAQRFDAGGGRVGTEFRVNTFTTSFQNDAAVASLGAERFVVTWTSYAQDGSGFGIFAQRYGDLIFRDGFEGGDTSRWSATASDGGDLSVSTDAALKFTVFGIQLLVDDTIGLFVQDDTPDDETTYRARFYFNPNDFDPGEAQAHFRTRIFLAFEESPTRRLLAIVLRRLAGQYSLLGRARRDDNSQADTGFFAISDAPHVVEIRWARASAPGANDGVFELRLDGVSMATNPTLDNDLSAVDFARMGALSVKTGASGTLHFDEFESRRETDIGP